SDSSVPCRELFHLAAVVVPLLLIRRLLQLGLSHEQVLAVLIGTYVLIRFGVSWLFKRLTVHRGIYHSIPAMAIAGLAVFLLYHSSDLTIRAFLAGGMMLGFLSHLVLDELYSVNFLGLKFRLNKYAGSALKLTSPSWSVTLVAYGLLSWLFWLAAREV